MVTIDKKGVLLNKTHLRFESEGVLNPATYQNGTTIHLFYRAVSENKQSSIGYCRIEDGVIVERLSKPVLFPEFDYEAQGVEDPRIVKIDGTYYLTYTAYDGVNALGALATSENMVVFEKQGIVTPKFTYDQFENIINSRKGFANRYAAYYNKNTADEINKKDFVWNKDVVFFPRRINGKLCFLHRIKPDIQLVAVNQLSDLTPHFWEDYIDHLEENTILKPKYKHENLHIGGGAPPIETRAGWLMIYHGVYDSPGNGFVYSACAALLDLENPLKEIARLPYPLFQPEHPWECEGTVNNVCFPSGTSIIDDVLTIYYGAADEQIAYATLSMSELLTALLTEVVQNADTSFLKRTK